MRLPRLLSSPSPKHFNFFSPSRLRPGKSEGGEGRWLHEPPRVAAEPLFSPLGQKRHRGPKSPPCPNPPPTARSGCQIQCSRILFLPSAPKHSQPLLGLQKGFLEGAKGTFIFLTYPLSPVPWSLEDQAFCKLHPHVLLLPLLQTFQGWVGKKAASLRTVYCFRFFWNSKLLTADMNGVL